MGRSVQTPALPLNHFAKTSASLSSSLFLSCARVN